VASSSSGQFADGTEALGSREGVVVDDANTSDTINGVDIIDTSSSHQKDL
jgi:hypothetical protein